MLQYLQIRNVALIDNLEIDFSPHFNVFTGETGAGKTIILNALNLVLGERASSGFISPDKDELIVTAIFKNKESSKEIVLQRKITNTGKSISKINDQIVSLNQLKKTAAALVDLHGQHDHQLLLDNTSHLMFLDNYAQLKNDKALVHDYFIKFKKIAEDLAQKIKKQKELQEKADFLRFQLQEIKDLNVTPKEDETIILEKEKLKHAKQIHLYAKESYENLKEVEASLTKVKLKEISNIDKTMQSLAGSLDELSYKVEFLKDEIRSYLDKITFDPNKLTLLEDRYHAISLAKRKYGGSIESILKKKKQLLSEVELIDDGNNNINNLNKELDIAEKGFFEIAQQLSIKRKDSAKLFENQLLTCLCDLEMEKSKISVDFKEVNPTLNGIDNIEFLISTNPGQPLKALSKIASGGELSRIMLALKTILANVDPVETMVFDEIDVGIGGKTAVAVAKKLTNLSTNKQIICITHLPQIASKADKHFVVKKSQTTDNTNVDVMEVKNNLRQQEIARMISGNITQANLKHAEELLT